MAAPSRRRIVLATVLALAALAVSASSVRAAGTTERVSVPTGGGQGSGDSMFPSISADGRYVAFASFAPDLVAGDTNTTFFCPSPGVCTINGGSDVFLHDRTLGTTVRVSVASGGTEANGDSAYPAISADGRFVAFESSADNLVAGITTGNNVTNVYVHDMQTGDTELVSGATAGGGGEANSSRPAISADGRYVSFSSQASDLVPGDSNGTGDAFLRDRQSGTTEIVSLDSAGDQVPAGAGGVSDDGQFVAFVSEAAATPNDSNGNFDVFVRDRVGDTTELVSKDSGGSQFPTAGLPGSQGSISGDGHFVLFRGGSGGTDLRVRDRQSGTTELISSAADDGELSSTGRFVVWRGASPVDSNTFGTWVLDRDTDGFHSVAVNGAGDPANDYTDGPATSADGRSIALYSPATNLTGDDDAGACTDVQPVFSGPGPPTGWEEVQRPCVDVFVRDPGEAPASVDSASEEAAAGGTVATNGTVTPADPVGTSVTTPAAGTVTIEEGVTTSSAPTGYSLLGKEVAITAPAGTAASPLVITFLLDSSVLPPGADAATLQVFRDGSPIADCSATAGSAAVPDPCIAERTSLTGGGVSITARTSHASTWNFGLHTAYAFQGFYAPIAAPPTLNPAQAGSAVSLRFSLGGNQGLGIFASGSPRSHQIACSGGGDLGDDAPTSGSLSFDQKSKRYTYAWKTSKAWASKTTSTCRQFVLRLIDGSTQSANFKFNK
jgi:Tol biopolymer transport system component